MSGKVCWNGFHHHALVGAALHLVETELPLASGLAYLGISGRESGETPLESSLPARRHDEILKLFRMQMRKAFGDSDHIHPACLGHRPVSELAGMMSARFTVDLMEGTLQQEARLGFSVHPGIMEAVSCLLETLKLMVVQYCAGTRLGESIPREARGFLDPAMVPIDFPEVYC